VENDIIDLRKEFKLSGPSKYDDDNINSFRMTRGLTPAFDFSQNTLITFENVVKGCFFNPKRSERDHFESRVDMPYSDISMDDLMKIPSLRLISKMNAKEIQLYDTSKINEALADVFLLKLKDSSWYGPYCYNS
jgi:hypothetical protein